MNPQSKTIRLEKKHIENFLALLERHETDFIGLSNLKNEPYRLYFVDSDLFSEYIDGSTRSPMSSWSSLLSLSTKDRGNLAEESVINLANIAGQAVVHYLFGNFLKNATFQHQRLYITHEHEREFKAIIYATITKTIETQSRDLLEKLRNQYEQLSQANTRHEGLNAAHNIIEILEKIHKSGSIERAFYLHKKAISPLGNNIISTPSENFKPFIFSTQDPSYVKQFLQCKEPTWEAFFNYLLQHTSVPTDIVKLKRFVFECYVNTAHLNKPYKFYINLVNSWMTDTNECPHTLRNRSDLRLQIKIAFLDAADLISIMQINALGLWLNTKHAQSQTQTWQMTLISGSEKISKTLDCWKSDTQLTLYRIHPLALMRHTDFWDPSSINKTNDTTCVDIPNEFALSRFFTDTNNKTFDSNNDIESFINSLKNQLELVVVRDAKNNDASLRKLKDALSNSQLFDRNDFKKTIRGLVTQQFALTYHFLADLFPAESNSLPENSIPRIHIEHSKTATTYINKLYTKDKQPDSHEDFINRSLEEDKTGYSALLALAIGYITRGRRWIKAAQIMAATATLLSKDAPPSLEYPEGHEALYLEAFLLRMSYTQNDDHEEFKHRHASMISKARAALSTWNNNQARILISAFNYSPPRSRLYELINFRYAIEENAANIFILIVDLNLKTSSRATINAIKELANTSLEMCIAWQKLTQPHQQTTSLDGENIFTYIQTGMCLLQSWLLWHGIIDRQTNSPSDLVEFEIASHEFVKSYWHHRDAIGSTLPALVLAFFKHAHPSNNKLLLLPNETDHYIRNLNIHFAGIDEIRMKWINSALEKAPIGY